MPKDINIQAQSELTEALKLFKRYIWVDAWIKVSGCLEVYPVFAFGTAKKMSVIDKICVQHSFRVSHKNSLTIIRVQSANVDEPCQPEAGTVADPLVAGFWEDLKQVYTLRSHEARAEAEARIWPAAPFRGLHPTVWISVEEGIGDQQRLPRRNNQAASTIKLGAGALVK
jgi:hypothetical protein